MHSLLLLLCHAVTKNSCGSSTAVLAGVQGARYNATISLIGVRFLWCTLFCVCYINSMNVLFSATMVLLYKYILGIVCTTADRCTLLAA